MSDFEKDDEQPEVDVELYATDDDGEFADADAYEFDSDDEDELSVEDFGEVEEAADESAPEPETVDEVDFVSQADAMLDGIKSESTYALHAETDAENFDPDEAPANAIVDSEDVASINEVSSSISEGDDVEELPDSIDISIDENVDIVEDDPIAAAESAARKRRRLRNVLIFFIILLVIVAAALGIFVWRSSTPPDVKPTDPDDMRTSTQTSTQIFTSIESDQIPEFVDYFGLTPDEAVEKSGNTISLDAESTPATDAAIPELKSMRNGWVVAKSGDIAVSISFGLDQDSKIIYTLATFDLDAYGVADAKFDELAASDVVASSVLAGIGLDDAVVDSAEVTVVDKPDAVTSRDTAGKEIVEFGGSTGRDAAPKEWKLTETYDHTAGTSLGDNSVIRTLGVELK